MASRLNLWLPCQPRILLQAGEVPSFPGDTHALAVRLALGERLAPKDASRLDASAMNSGLLRPRKAQRGPERHRRSVDRTSLSCAWLEAPHKEICNQGGSPQISQTMHHHVHWVPHINPLETQGLPTSRITDDKGGSPQGRLYGFCRLYCHREVQP